MNDVEKRAMVHVFPGIGDPGPCSIRTKQYTNRSEPDLMLYYNETPLAVLSKTMSEDYRRFIEENTPANNEVPDVA